MSDFVIEDLNYILSSIDIISGRFSNIKTANDFTVSPYGVMLLDSIAMRLQGIGETVKQISKRNKDLFGKYPEIDWQEIIRMRDFIFHHYEDIDEEIVFNICQNHLPGLKATIEKIIKDLEK